MSCITNTTTSSGTFLFSKGHMTRCEAKKFCREKGGVLAPITTQEDKDAVLEMINPECFEHYLDNMYHIGLDVYNCGDQQERVFSNGIIYDKNVHGHLYDDLGEPDDKCPETFMMYSSANPLTIGSKGSNCYPSHYRALCLIPPASDSSPINQDESAYIKLSFNQSLAVAGGMLCFVVVNSVFAARVYKRSKEVQKKLCDLES